MAESGFQRAFNRADDTWNTVESVLALPLFALGLLFLLGAKLNSLDPDWGQENLLYSLTILSLTAVIAFFRVSGSSISRPLVTFLLIASAWFLVRGAYVDNPNPATREAMASWKLDKANWELIQQEVERTDPSNLFGEGGYERRMEFLVSRGRCTEYQLDERLHGTGIYREWCPKDHDTFFETFPGGCNKYKGKFWFCCDGGRPGKYIDKEAISPRREFFDVPDDGVRYTCMARRISHAECLRIFRATERKYGRGWRDALKGSGVERECANEMTEGLNRGRSLEAPSAPAESSPTLSPSVNPIPEMRSISEPKDPTYCLNWIALAKARVGTRWVQEVPSDVSNQCQREIRQARGEEAP